MYSTGFSIRTVSPETIPSSPGKDVPEPSAHPEAFLSTGDIITCLLESTGRVRFAKNAEWITETECNDKLTQILSSGAAPAITLTDGIKVQLHLDAPYFRAALDIPEAQSVASLVNTANCPKVESKECVSECTARGLWLSPQGWEYEVLIDQAKFIPQQEVPVTYR